MKTYYIIFLLFLTFSLSGLQAYGQCFAEISTDPENGSQNLTIQYYGSGGETGVFYACDDVSLPTGWTSTPFTIGSPCTNPDGSAPDATDYLWVAARDGSGKRWLSTDDMDMSDGGKIKFEIRYGVTDVGSDCRGPNHESQGVALEYSNNAGGDWIRITYYLPYSIDTVFTNWNEFEYDVPAGAQTASTRFRWYQDNASNDETDRWGLNNILINTGVTVTDWDWDFGDLTGSTDQNPLKIYGDYGVYDVSLTITTSDLCVATKDTTIYINTDPTINPISNVSISSTGNTTDIPISGITDGGVGGQILSVSTTYLSQGSLIEKTVNYTSPNTTGLITVTPDSTLCGDATIKAKVEYTNVVNMYTEEVFVVFVNDDTKPEITTVADIAFNILSGKCDTIVNYSDPVGTDNCSGSFVTQTEGLASGSSFPAGVTTNTFVVTDGNGNQTPTSFTVTITEPDPPTITCPPDIAENECNNDLTIAAPVANDDCGIDSVYHDSPYGVSNSDASGVYPVGTTVITWTAVDVSGNTNFCTQTVEITPNPDPPVADDVNYNYGENVVFSATPDTDHYIRWYINSDLSGTPVESSTLDLGVLDPGVYTRYATQVSNTSGCESTANTVTATVGKVELTVTADDKSKIYGEVNPLLTFQYSGFIDGDNESVIDTVPTASTSADETSNTGDYLITVSGGSDDKYSFTYVDGTLTINRAVLIATADNKSRSYGESNPLFTIQYSGFVNGEDETVIDTEPVSSTLADETSPVEDYSITLTGGSDNNYTFSLVDGTLTINKASLTVTADDKEKVYGEVNPALTIQYSGFVNSEDETVIDTEPVSSTLADETSDAGDYEITLSGGNDNNYDFNYINGTLTVTKIDQTISFDDIPASLRVTEEHTLVGASTSGETVEFEASDPSVVSITGNNMLVLKEGIVTITANCDGGVNYNPASELAQVIETKPAFDNSTSLFTPNMDGRNDYWHIPYIEEMGVVDVKVYNRHGRLVYESKAYTNDWDGTSNGKPLPEGSYYYILNSSEKGSMKGVINIVR